MIPNPLSLEANVPAPFQFRFSGDLLEEMCADELFRLRPKNDQEAARIGFIYGKKFDPDRPGESIERILAQYSGLTPRVIFAAFRLRGTATNLLMIRDENMFCAAVPLTSMFAQLYRKTLGLLAARGVTDADQGGLLLPVNGKENSEPLGRVGAGWAIGYERGSGLCAIIDGRGGIRVELSNFLRHQPFAPVDIRQFKTKTSA